MVLRRRTKEELTTIKTRVDRAIHLRNKLKEHGGDILRSIDWQFIEVDVPDLLIHAQLTDNENENLSGAVKRLQRENDELRKAADAECERARLVTIHICATETGISATYPDDADAATVAALVWRYIRQAIKRGETLRGPIRGPFQEGRDGQ